MKALLKRCVATLVPRRRISHGWWCNLGFQPLINSNWTPGKWMFGRRVKFNWSTLEFSEKFHHFQDCRTWIPTSKFFATCLNPATKLQARKKVRVTWTAAGMPLLSLRNHNRGTTVSKLATTIRTLNTFLPIVRKLRRTPWKVKDWSLQPTPGEWSAMYLRNANLKRLALRKRKRVSMERADFKSSTSSSSKPRTGSKSRRRAKKSARRSATVEKQDPLIPSVSYSQS